MHARLDHSEAEVLAVRPTPTLDPIKHGGEMLNPTVPPGHHAPQEPVPSQGVSAVATHRVSQPRA